LGLSNVLHCMTTKRPNQAKGDRDFVELLQLIQTYDMDCVSMACELAIEAKTTQLSAIINRVHRLTETEDTIRIEVIKYPQLECPPQADCQRYNQLLTTQEVA